MTIKSKQQESKKRRQSEAPKAQDECQKQAESHKDVAGPAGIHSAIPVVGIGGSAGSLEAFKTFFTNMPVDSGAAFVVIQHLAPTHESLLAELLAQHTRMRVTQACNASPIEPNCVYVIPPNQYLNIREGVLYLVEPAKSERIRMPIDFFFRSLAEDRRERAICILFSGAGSDGTLGVRVIRGAGGLAIAQDPQTAQFSDMPRSAVETGLVDFVLPPERIPEALLDYLRNPYVKGGEPAAVLEAEGKPGDYQDILSLVLAQKGHDFKFYKKSTIVRRIERRMGLHRIPDLAGYYNLLRQDTDEVNQLFKDLLINVTSFFRDAEVFEEFSQKAIAPLVRAKKTNEPLRVWVAGSASGEEAYSMAILLMEEIVTARKSCPVQIFATDIDDEALEIARHGVYPENIAVDVAPERLSRFFIRNDRGYQVNEQVRKSVVFASQNLINDPPFSKMDIIICRNLLIYLDAETQTKLIPLFNFALNPGGYLFLGKSEGICGQNDLFDVVSKQARLFRRLNPTRPYVLDSPILPGKKRALPLAGPIAVKPPVTAYADIIRLAMLNHFAAAVVLVDRTGQILQFHGNTGKYLNMPTTEPSLNLLDIAKEGLPTRLRAAFYKTLQDGMTVLLDNVPITRDRDSSFVRVTIAPAPQRGSEAPLFAVIFEDIPRPLAPAAEQIQSGESESAVKQLEDELRATRQEHQVTIDELQASNEELRVSNEEVASTNEELQSTVEELETSKEELQSVNEELSIVNSQLQEKVEKLDAANSDIANFLESTQIATLFLDRDLLIKRFTPATTKVLKLISSDTGRPIGDLSTNFTNFDLPSDARSVAVQGNVVERVAHHADGSRYLVRIMPYRMQMGEIAGVIINFGDITRLSRAEQQTRRLATVVMDSNDAVLLFDLDGKILTWNRGAQDMYGWGEAEALRMTIRDIVPPDKVAEATDIFRQLSAGERVPSCESQRITKNGRILDIWLTATSVSGEAGKIVEAFATTERDIAESKKAAQNMLALNEQLKRRVAELDTVNKELEAFTYSVSHDLRAPLNWISGFSQLLFEQYADRFDMQGKDFLTRVKNGSNRMIQLIEDLLRLSHISRQDISFVDYDLSGLASSVVKSFRDAAPARNVKVVIAGGLHATVDPNLMRIALTNLFDNAWKFTSKIENAHIEFGAAEKDEKTVYFIKDNGAGFDPSYADKMFLPFHRLHSEKEFEGMGIGLAIVERIIRRHDGKVWAEGEVDKGATIYFTLGQGTKNN